MVPVAGLLLTMVEELMYVVEDVQVESEVVEVPFV